MSAPLAWLASGLDLHGSVVDAEPVLELAGDEGLRVELLARFDHHMEGLRPLGRLAFRIPERIKRTDCRMRGLRCGN
ncbi:MAG: hypothetical protein AB7G13_06870 [Lautropia sp.]